MENGEWRMEDGEWCGRVTPRAEEKRESQGLPLKLRDIEYVQQRVHALKRIPFGSFPFTPIFDLIEVDNGGGANIVD
jgi:hypothetical protein